MSAGILHLTWKHEGWDVFMSVGDGIQAPLLVLVITGLIEWPPWTYSEKTIN